MTDTNGLIRDAGGPRPKDDLVEQIRTFLADAPKGKPHEGYRYGELLSQAAAEIERLRAENARLNERISPDAKAIAKSLRQWSDEDVRIASGQLPPLGHREKTMGYIAARYIEALWSNFERAEAERNALRADAERWRTARNRSVIGLFNAAIDAARKEKP